MERVHDNLNELRNFVSYHKLMNSHSIIQFIAKVTIITAQNKIENEEMKVSITYDEYGKVTILESHINPYLYPTVFDPRWQRIENVEDVFLRISDTHTKNPVIGKYEVKIVPLKIIE